MSPKAALRDIASLVKQEKFPEAVEQAEKVICDDAKSFNAQVLLAYALDKLKRYDEAEKAYLAAADIKPADLQPLQGLVQLYQSRGPSPRLRDTVVRLALAYAVRDDLYRAQDTIDKYMAHVRSCGPPEQIEALAILLPDGPLFATLEGRITPPARTYQTLIGLLEAEEKKKMAALIAERRTRLGATLVQVTLEAKREVYAASALERRLREAIVWTVQDDDQRRRYEEMLLLHCHDRMTVTPLGPEKGVAVADVRIQAEGMVIIRHPLQLAWDIAIDWQDHAEISAWDPVVLHQFCAYFPDSDLAKVIGAFLTCAVSPFPPPPPPQKDPTDPKKDQAEAEAEAAGTDKAAPTIRQMRRVEDERMALISDAITGANSILAYRLIGEYYESLEEYEGVVDAMRAAFPVLNKLRAQTGLRFDEAEAALSRYLGTALIFHQRPDHHPEAKLLLAKVLARNPAATGALIGVGLIHQEEEDYDSAIDFLDRALRQDGTNIWIRVEAAWVRALRGDLTAALAEFEACAPLVADRAKVPSRVRARASYGLGYCLWHLDPSRPARKSRIGPYHHFLAAIRTDITFAPAYTSLGLYYADYSRDRDRARSCFRRAIELSPDEVVAAERLARSFADDGDWDRVELVARRVVESGRVRPPAGSRRRALGWPHAALGVALLNSRKPELAISSFQTALRLAPDDYRTWVGLGESYHLAGRHVAATKALENARRLEADDAGLVAVSPEERWFTAFLLANVRRALGSYEDAIPLYRAAIETRPAERSVSIALLEAMVEGAHSEIRRGYYGRAGALAAETIRFAAERRDELAGAFNYWKAVGDAAAVFTIIQSRAAEFPADQMRDILRVEGDGKGGAAGEEGEKGAAGEEGQDGASGEEGQGGAAEEGQDGTAEEEGKTGAAGAQKEEEKESDLAWCIRATVLAHRRAVGVAADSAHAQSVAYYNLGWAEHRAHCCLPRHLRSSDRRKGRRGGAGAGEGHARAAVAAFKRAIEIEAGNAHFWNALGVAASRISPAVAQHAFVRSLYRNDRSAAAWTNLATLAILHSDLPLANLAYARAQSAEPDYAHAWAGQSLVAARVGDPHEARELLTHAAEIVRSPSLVTRRLYPAAVFDHLVSQKKKTRLSSAASPLGPPLFALEQMGRLQPADRACAHLASLLKERAGGANAAADAIAVLEVLCSEAEAEYERTEGADAIGRFAMAKADLGRTYLAAGRRRDAIGAAETALDLSNDEADNELTPQQRSRTRLSANLTIGLARHREGEADEAVASLEAALQEIRGGGDDDDGDDGDIVCLLSQVLWAAGDPASRARARKDLADLIRKQPLHFQANAMLAVMALRLNDEPAMEVARSRLHSLRVAGSDAGLSHGERARAGLVLGALARRQGGSKAALAEAQAEIMLAPYRPHGWTQLATLVAEADEAGAAAIPTRMALRVTEQLASDTAVTAAAAAAGSGGGGSSIVAGFGESEMVEPDELAAAYARTGRAADAQRAIFTAPWVEDGWKSLAAAVGKAAA